jgi:hypothetical protein
MHPNEKEIKYVEGLLTGAEKPSSSFGMMILAKAVAAKRRYSEVQQELMNLEKRGKELTRAAHEANAIYTTYIDDLLTLKREEDRNEQSLGVDSKLGVQIHRRPVHGVERRANEDEPGKGFVFSRPSSNDVDLEEDDHGRGTPANAASPGHD